MTALAALWVFSRLPFELQLEVAHHMDLSSLSGVIKVFPHIRRASVLITDREMTSPLFKQLYCWFPGVDCIEVFALEKGPECHLPYHLKILDLGSGLELDGHQIYDYMWSEHGAGHCGVCTSSHYGHNVSIPAVISDSPGLLGRSTFILDSHLKYTSIQAWFDYMSWVKGVNLLVSSNLFLTPKTRLPNGLKTRSWGNLKKVNVVHDSFVHLGRMTNVTDLFVTFKGQGRELSMRPVLKVEYVPVLENLKVHYAWCLVPSIDLGEEAFNPYSRETQVEICRLVDGSNRQLTSRSPMETLQDKESYPGKCTFLSRCAEVSLVGVPDWFALLHSYDFAGTFSWGRMDPSQLPGASPHNSRLLLCTHYCHIRTWITDDVFPVIVNTNAEDLVHLEIGIHAHLASNGLASFLPSSENLYRLIIRAYPYDDRWLHGETVRPAFSLNAQDFSNLQFEQLVISGDVDLTDLLGAEGIDREFGEVDLDLTTTVAMNVGKHLDVRFIPLGRAASEYVRLRCSKSQNPSISFHSPRELYAGDTVTPTGPWIEVPSVIFDKHLTNMTFEGEPLLNQELSITNSQPLTHLVLQGSPKKYVNCYDICLRCVPI